MRFLFILLFLGCFDPPVAPKIEGCTDAIACNYDSSANLDDNSCAYEVSECGTCVSMNYYDYYLSLDIQIPEEYNSDLEDISVLTDDNDTFELTKNQPLSESNASALTDAFIFKEATIQVANSFILLSAPHAQRAYRDNEEEHDSEFFTGSIAFYMHELLGIPILCSKYKSDDPNYYHLIPDNTQTPLFINNIGDFIPFKDKMKDYILEDTNNISLVIDLHGFDQDNRSDFDIMLGTMGNDENESPSLQSELGCYIPDIIEAIFEKHEILNITENHPNYTAGISKTITKFVIDEVSIDSNNILDALQMEVEKKYRGATDNNHLNFINALAEIIYVLNYLYTDLNIYSQPI